MKKLRPGLLPDWTLRLNGIIMLTGTAVPAFSGVRLVQRKEN